MMDKFTKLNKKCLTKASLIRISEKGGFSFLILRCTTSCLATYLVSCSTVSGISFLSNSRIVIFLSVFASLLFASMIPFRSTPVVSFIDSMTFIRTAGTFPAISETPLLSPPITVTLSMELIGSAIAFAISGRILTIISVMAASPYFFIASAFKSIAFASASPFNWIARDSACPRASIAAASFSCSNNFASASF